LRLDPCEADSAAARGAGERCGCGRERPDVDGGAFDFFAGNNHLNKDMADFHFWSDGARNEAFRGLRTQCSSAQQKHQHLFRHGAHANRVPGNAVK
jgi:hypothetical protein